jgi:hypothetical protein
MCVVKNNNDPNWITYKIRQLCKILRIVLILYYFVLENERERIL